MTLSQAVSAKLRTKAETVERARAEFNFSCIAPEIAPRSNVLDIGAWKCYLGELLQERRGCDVLGLDVVDANKTDVPLRLFDGQTLPVDSGDFDVVLLLYVLHHAAEDERLLQEARRVLTDDGILIIAEDVVDGLWNRVLTMGFHVWLWLVTGMTWNGQFRKIAEWQKRFQSLGFETCSTKLLGHHLGRCLWPRNVLFVLRKAR
jgi:SAM-dependent methyltransferase